MAGNSGIKPFLPDLAAGGLSSAIAYNETVRAV
jgi:hypothetical protein